MRIIIVLLLPFLLVSTTQIDRDTLSNGLVILTVEAHKIPVVEMRAYVRAGSVFDPAGKEGLASLVSQMLIRGTEYDSYDEIVRSIESVGGVLTPFTSEDYGGVSGKALSKDLPELIHLMGECLTAPLFDSLELSRLKRETVSFIKAQYNDPFEISEKGFRNLIFGDHPLGHFPEGFDSTVMAVSGFDIRSFYDDYYHPNNTFLVCVGDFSKDTLMALLNESLGQWGRGVLPDLRVAEPIATDRKTAKIIPMDISQAYILLGNLGPKYGTIDWHATRVMNYILGGGGLTSRISSTIREEKGLAYIAYSYFRRFENGGYFTAEVQTKKENVSEAVHSLLDEIQSIQDEIHVQELESVKKFYTGYLPLAYDTYREMVQIIAQIQMGGYGLDYLARFESEINALEIEDLNVVAQKYLHPDRYYLLIVGDVEPDDVDVEGVEWIE
ncbi:MAG: pitrilysin family protein [candidate division WOR-3 bacterium]|jgi:zinc protease